MLQLSQISQNYSLLRYQYKKPTISGVVRKSKVDEQVDKLVIV